MTSIGIPYCYQPISPGPDTIRLLHLLPSENKDAPIQCRLIDYSLQISSKRKHLYEALSYVWGGENKPNSLSVDGRILSITASLHAALLRLRDYALGRFLWVDAVCINQNDDIEKEHQIAFMAQIYGFASRTIVWLGEAANDSNQAIEDIHLAASGGLGASYYTISDGKKTITEQRAITNLLHRPWFRRIWVSRSEVRNISVHSLMSITGGSRSCCCQTCHCHVRFLRN
jgi:hypothetical protein